MYLDCDTTPPIKSRPVAEKHKLDSVIKIATSIIAMAIEGQIGIYDTPRGDGFHGYIIKYPGKEPYFEEATVE